MGSLNLPLSGLIYVDTAPIIYSVDKNPDFYPFITNDTAFRRVPGLNIVVLSELI
jgi:hypothetical protein